jgi:hypothetical protein
MINPPRSVQDKKEVAFKDVKGVPMGEDVIMASRISPSSVDIIAPMKDFEEPATLGWPQGERSLQQEFSAADCTFTPI